MAHSKRYNEINKLIDKNKLYPTGEAIELAKKTSTTKFDASIEIHIRLGINPQKTEQTVKGTVTMPHGTGKSKRVAAFTEAQQKEAKEAGADIIGGQELIEEIKKTSKCDFDVAVAEPAIMPKLAQIAKILGPKGLMPSPKNETVTPNINKAISELKKGKITFKNDDGGCIHQIIGKASFETKNLAENFNALLEAVRKAKPGSAKGTYIQKVTLCSSMGPSIRVEA